MDWINYHHLLYFWVVAREGSIARACQQLHLAQPTISGQIRQLEKSLGHRLFHRAGRRLVLTEFGQTVYGYAEAIFALGQELQDVVRGRSPGRPMRFAVGVPDILPKLITFRLLEPAMGIEDPVRLIVREAPLENLLADLAVHQLDLVLSDTPAPPSAHVKAYSHLLGECGVTLFAAPDLASACRQDDPASLGRQPWLLPAERTSMRRSLDQWLAANAIEPEIVGEFEDSALMKVFGQSGRGLFPAPTAIEAEVVRQFNVEVVGRIDDVRERYYAISIDRRLKHPAVLALSEAAKEQLFR